MTAEEFMYEVVEVERGHLVACHRDGELDFSGLAERMWKIISTERGISKEIR